MCFSISLFWEELKEKKLQFDASKERYYDHLNVFGCKILLFSLSCLQEFAGAALLGLEL